MTKKIKVIAVVGPSASGKTSLAIELAKAFDGEVISADSRLIYKEFDVATAKPTEEEKQGVVHHLIDIIQPTQDFSVADFADVARVKIKEISDRGKLPIVAGGTGFYFRVLLENLDLPRVAPNPELRKKLEEKSAEELYQMLVDSDSEIAEKIHKNNKVKIIRALEVIDALDIPMTEAQGTKESDYDTLWIGLNAKNRDFLYQRINQRVESMIENGLLDESKKLYNKYPDLELLLNTIGYQEFEEYFKGNIGLDESIELIKQNTRRYAKRQLSWFRSNKNINWFNIDEMTSGEILETVREKVSSFRSTQSC